MGWGFIFKGVALYLGFRVLDLVFAVFQPSTSLASTVMLIYSLGVIAYMGSSMVLAAKIILGRSPSH
jgi:hypothetical protein